MAQEDCKGIWVFAEQQNGELNDTVFEILAQALDLKKHTGEEVTAVLLGKGVTALAPVLFEYGADAAIVAENDALAQYSARPYEKALRSWLKSIGLPSCSTGPPRWGEIWLRA